MREERDMYQMKKRQTFGFSAENPTGTRNGGTRGGDCEKLNAFRVFKPGETVTICDVEGQGMITHMKACICKRCVQSKSAADCVYSSPRLRFIPHDAADKVGGRKGPGLESSPLA